MDVFLPQNIIHFCPKCGSGTIDFFENKMFSCQECGFTLFINSASAVTAVIRNAKNEVLVTRRNHDPGKAMLDLPGGFVDILESAEDALRREIKEELSLDIVDLKFFRSFPNRYIYNDLLYYTLDLVFFCSTEHHDTIALSEEIYDIKFLPVKEMDPAQFAFESVKNIIKALKVLP